MPDALSRRVPPWLIWAALAGLAAALSVGPILDGLSGDALDRAFLFYSVLPRGVVALLAGAALGLSGALLQQALDNPLAEPSTLGVFAGAQLALGAAAAFAPGLGALG
ncbi:iron chelate uptake ABC transporter family permease subunit, partial [Methylopila musalis]